MLREKPTWTKLTIIVFLVIAIIAAGVCIFIVTKLNKINHLEEVEIIPPEQEYFETDDSGYKSSDEITEKNSNDTTENDGGLGNRNITWPTDGDVLMDKNIINILLIGQDREPGQPRARSDSMMIGTINKKNKTIKVTSLMRDMYIQIPGYSDNRINAAYAFGGMKLLDATIEKNFQVHIDGNVEVDFERFQQIIDKLGGVDITINAVEAKFLNDRGFTGPDKQKLTEGLVHMDGVLALEYSRIRYVGNADYERTERQKRVLLTVFNNIKGLGIPKILGFVDEIFPLVNTDLSNGQIISFATTVAMMGVENIGTYRIPADNSFTPRKIRRMSVLVPDLIKNRAALKNIIFGE